VPKATHDDFSLAYPSIRLFLVAAPIVYNRHKLLQHLDPALCRYKGATLAVGYRTLCLYIRSARGPQDSLLWDRSKGSFPKLQSLFLVHEDPELVSKGDVELVDITDLRQLDDHFRVGFG
jgi:hypothetical protein